METVLIQADLMVYQAATATPLVSTSMDTPATGGLLQSPVPTHGDVNCTTTSTVFTETASIGTTAFLLVASGIKNLYLNNAVALCSNGVVISIQ